MKELEDTIRLELKYCEACGRLRVRPNGDSSHYRAASFEDQIIFVHDVDRALAKLDSFSQQLLARVVLQDFTEAEAAQLLHVGLRTVERHLPLALDAATVVLVHAGLLGERGE